MGVYLSEKQVDGLELERMIKIKNQLGNLIRMSGTKSGIPAALSDVVLQCTWADLGHYVDDHRDDKLLKMQEYVKPIQLQNKQGSLSKLLRDFEDDMTSYRKDEKKSKRVPRSEKNWDIFAEVGEVLADWIGSTTTLSATESLSMRSMFCELRIFDATFPSRVPRYLFQ
ncbi:hypothetical protein PHMEG_00015384 [Phytophthora megakarya]|uniref:Uncharacterized protein n=1 Tax=Phytophthora megakarya TaxID=4795 RepID=A0A225W1D9_9STRA|nr:hypothetical protein PHMEG_00015384 [Phytophthora megakarya]